MLLWYLPGMLTVIGLFGYGLWRSQLALGYGLAAQNTWGRNAFIWAAILLVPLLILMIRHWHSRRRAVLVYTNGIRFKAIRQAPDALLWNQIAGITEDLREAWLWKLRLSNRCRVTIIPGTGKPLKLDERISRLPDLVDHIKRQIYPTLESEMHAQLRKGQRLFFGPLQFSQESWRWRKRETRWRDTSSVQVKKGRLIIEQKDGKKVAISTGQIPNLELFLTLIDKEITL